MASGAENNQPRKQDQPASGQTVSRGGNNYPPPAMSYPQQAYPPPAYAGYGYNPYPPAAYAQDPTVAYYGTHQYANDGNACFRCICFVMMLSLMLTIMASIIFFFVPKPNHTAFKVETFTVSDFNVNPANKVVTGKWQAKVGVQNGRTRLRFRTAEPSLYQKDTWLAAGTDTATMTSGYWDDVGWDSSDSTMEFKFEVRNSTGPAEDMQKEIKDNGGVTFTLKLNLDYVETSSGFWWHVKNGNIKVTCKDLKIGLAVGANTGTLTGDRKDCEIDNK